eukprot:1823754-Rhodomonas_salina.1
MMMTMQLRLSAYRAKSNTRNHTWYKLDRTVRQATRTVKLSVNGRSLLVSRAYSPLEWSTHTSREDVTCLQTFRWEARV